MDGRQRTARRRGPEPVITIVTTNSPSDGTPNQIIRHCAECDGLPLDVSLKSLGFVASEQELVVTVLSEADGQTLSHDIVFSEGVLVFRVMDESHFIAWDSALCTEHPPTSAVSEVLNSTYVQWFVQSATDTHYSERDLRHIEIVTPDDCIDVIVHTHATFGLRGTVT